MTLNRALLILTILILGLLAFLSFAPPQMGKWVYIWQAYVIEADADYMEVSGLDRMVTKSASTKYLNPSDNFTGSMEVWDRDGNWAASIDFIDGQLNLYSPKLQWKYSGDYPLEASLKNGSRLLIRTDRHRNLIFMEHTDAAGSLLYRAFHLPGLYKLSEQKTIRNGELFTKWSHENGELQSIAFYRGGTEHQVVFDSDASIDRRAEFGIEVN